MRLSKSQMFSKQNILKMVLITITIILWMYFYISSSVSLDSLIVFDFPSIINTFFTINFVLFLLFFPLTSAVTIALSTQDNKLHNIYHIIISFLLGFLISFLIFGLSTKIFIFVFFYILSHILLSILCYNKFSESTKKIFSYASYSTSKISLLLTISLFIILFLLILPHQQEYAKNTEAGIVDMFVGDDIGEWIGTSYQISKVSMKSNLDYIMSIQQYKDLEEVNNTKVKDFLYFMDQFKEGLSKTTTPEEIKASFPDLNSKNLKDKVLATIHNIPFMIVLESYFAFIFAIIFASMAQLYFSIGFGLLGLLYIYLFYKLFYIK